MKEADERDDELRSLIREEGLLTTAPDFTLRVMQLIGEEEKKPDLAYTPLLSRNAWRLIAASVLLLLALCFLVSTGSQDNVRYFSEVLKPAADFMQQVDFTFHFSSRALLLAICIVSSVGVLLSIDIWMTHRNPGLSA